VKNVGRGKVGTMKSKINQTKEINERQVSKLRLNKAKWKIHQKKHRSNRSKQTDMRFQKMVVVDFNKKL
jgi:hypothetical protein